MLLKPACSVASAAFLLLVLGGVHPARAQSDWHLENTLQVGLDAWHIAHSAPDRVTRDTMYLADSAPRWSYREASPWYTLQSQLHMGAKDLLVLRVRANQGLGSALDQLYHDHAISPSLGIRAGVADYRATWCREYDLDNPWVRESDPFCTDQRIRQPTSSAPALQAYVNLAWGSYQMQGVAGIFRPRALGYAPREFGTAMLPEHVSITKNHKQGLSLNLLDKATSTEWRLSWIGLDQSLFDSQASLSFPQFPAGAQLNYHQRANTYFAGVSWPISLRLRARLTHMKNALTARCELLTPQADSGCSVRVAKEASVLEMNYQLNSEDLFSLSFLRFPFGQSDVYEKTNQNVSASWRREWGGHWFTALQLSRSRATVQYNRDFSTVSYLPGTASAWGAGFRLGYRL